MFGVECCTFQKIDENPFKSTNTILHGFKLKSSFMRISPILFLFIVFLLLFWGIVFVVLAELFSFQFV